MIEFLNNIALTSEKLNRTTEFLIDGFLPKRMITMFYADGGVGKTWVSYGAAAFICENRLAKAVYYIDLDNPLDVLAERKVENMLINKYDNIKYIHRSDLAETALQTLERLASKECSKNHAYEDVVFIVDSIRNVTNIKNDERAMYMFNLLMDIREAGATILLVAHTNKDGKNYEGSNNVRNSIDAMFEAEQIAKVQDVSITIGLLVRKERAGIKGCVWTIDVNTLNMTTADALYSRMTHYEKEFSSKVKAILEKYPEGLNQGELLHQAGFKKDDKTARATLEKFEDKMWSRHQDKKGLPMKYMLISPKATTATTVTTP